MLEQMYLITMPKNLRFRAELLGDNDRIFASQEPHLEKCG